jgi:hypothetical protein
MYRMLIQVLNDETKEADKNANKRIRR